VIGYDPLAAHAAPIRAVFDALERPRLDCSTCGGSGGGPDPENACPSCHGSGRDSRAARAAREEQRIENHIDRQEDRRRGI